MPALFTSASIDLKRDSAVSTILAAVAGSATWLEAATLVDWVTFRELATTLKPCSTNAFTISAPIPCDAPVTMAVFCGLLMVVYLENILPLETIRWSSGSEIRVQHDPVTCFPGFKPGERLVDLPHREVLSLRNDVVP